MGEAKPPRRRKPAARIRHHPNRPTIKILTGTSSPPEGQPRHGRLEGRGAGAVAVRGDRRRTDLVPDRRHPTNRLDYLRGHRPPQGHGLREWSSFEGTSEDLLRYEASSEPSDPNPAERWSSTLSMTAGSRWSRGGLGRGCPGSSAKRLSIASLISSASLRRRRCAAADSRLLASCDR